MADQEAMAFVEKRKPKPGVGAVPVFRPLDFDSVRRQVRPEVPDIVVRKLAAMGDPKKIEYANKAADVLKEKEPSAFRLLSNGQIADFFAKSALRAAYALANIAKAAGEGTADQKKKAAQVKSAFDSLLDVAPLFARYPNLFVSIARDAGKRAGSAFSDFEGKSPDAFVLAAATLHKPAAIELGMPLDIYHDDKKARAGYLKDMSAVEVLSLLCSDPELFYTSSNHMLFDRLLTETRNDRGLEGLQRRFGLDDEQLRNFVLRAINYGRINDFISDKARDQDLRLIVESILGTPQKRNGIYAEGYDSKYFYLIANGIESIRKHLAGVDVQIGERIKQLEGKKDKVPDEDATLHALRYVRFILTGKGEKEGEMAAVARRAVFDPSEYQVGGKLRVLQVFSREDTGRDHWPATKSWYAAAGYRLASQKSGKDGDEAVFERPGVRVTLFMGRGPVDNAEYAAEWVKGNKAGIVTFRGHSYSLVQNMPHDVFGNQRGRYIFIPGSCGSSGNVPMYIVQNPNTEMKFFSNTSTGRGQVTNTLVDMLIAQRKPVLFSDMLAQGSRRIEARLGDISTIKVWNPGEALLYYVSNKTGAGVAVASL